jgi:hypothetical protein
MAAPAEGRGITPTGWLVSGWLLLRWTREGLVLFKGTGGAHRV